MKKLLFVISLLFLNIWAQEPQTELRQRFPDRASWEINYVNDAKFSAYLDDLASDGLRKDKPKEITAKLNRFYSQARRKPNRGLQSKEVIKNKKDYYEILNYQDVNRRTTRYILNQNFAFTKHSNFPRYTTSGRSAFVDSKYTETDFPPSAKLTKSHYRGDVIIDNKLFQVYSIPDAERPISQKKLVHLWYMHRSLEEYRNQGEYDSEDSDLALEDQENEQQEEEDAPPSAVKLPSEKEMREVVFGKRSAVFIINKRTKRPFLIKNKNTIRRFKQVAPKTFPKLPPEIERFVKFNPKEFAK